MLTGAVVDKMDGQGIGQLLPFEGSIALCLGCVLRKPTSGEQDKEEKQIFHISGFVKEGGWLPGLAIEIQDY